MSKPDPFDDPEWLAYADRALEEMIPKLEDSAITVAIVPSKPENRTDMKFCLELGAMIMLDKPIIMLVAPGQPVPSKIVAVADKIVELDTKDPSFHARLMAAITEVQTKLEGN